MTRSESDTRTGRLMRVHDVEKLLNVPRRTVRWWARTGRLPAVRLGKRAWAFRREDVVAFYDERVREREL